MTIEEAEEIIRSNPSSDFEEESELGAARETILSAIRHGCHIANYYGVTLEAERRIMKNSLRLIAKVVDDYVFGCDSENDDWRDYFTGYSDELDEKVKNASYPSDFCYHLPSDEWLFKNLISWGTARGGMGSACEECGRIGKIMKSDDESI